MLSPNIPLKGKKLLQNRLVLCHLCFFVFFFPPLPRSLSSLLTAAVTANLLDLEDPAKLTLSGSANSAHLDNSMFGPSSSVNNNMMWVSAQGTVASAKLTGIDAASILCALGPLSELALRQNLLLVCVILCV